MPCGRDRRFRRDYVCSFVDMRGICGETRHQWMYIKLDSEVGR